MGEKYLDVKIKGNPNSIQTLALETLRIYQTTKKHAGWYPVDGSHGFWLQEKKGLEDPSAYIYRRASELGLKVLEIKERSMRQPGISPW